MKHKVVLITGVAGGIGTATARVFKKAGWHVIGIGRRKIDMASNVHHFIKGDVSQVKTWEHIKKEIYHRKGHIDALVNNAAVQICKPLVKTTPKEWDKVMAVNLRSVYLSVCHLYPLMRNLGGSIVNVSSVHAVATSSNIAAYAASKGAIVALTRAMAIELASDKIRVNAVLPGAVDTKMLHAGLKRGHLAGKNIRASMSNLADKTVIGRIGKPEEIAQAIFFLSEEKCSSFITGQAFIVDGGATIRLSTEG